MPTPPTVTIPGPLSNANAPHVSGIAAFDTYISQLQNSNRPEDQAVAGALSQISNALNQIVRALIQAKATTFNVPVAYVAPATSGLTLTTTSQAIPGCSITLPTSGQYLVIATESGAVDTASGLVFSILFANGAQFTGGSDGMATSGNGGFNITRSYVYNGTAGDVLQMQSSKQNVAGSANATSLQTSLTAVWLNGGGIVVG
jgi:hypothetical protein